ncbi:hypothetical protein WH221_06590 [Chryseobacterium culicis]|uniref:Uncharacterized protein n=2 Tax=Chryseobacterium culicis TaxID=680127 RepID=A0A2S9CZH4_CHRCI|nr:hypothetical protein [Chryseobacterium culicis]PRB85909.1 hypothetical protein CQ022_06555 [Chryseobacterium culicis]PRB91662.1 hypothetical protein CQ033_00225 [Chryseobacterium culicis]
MILSKINYTLAILIIALNLVILPINIIMIMDSKSLFQSGMDIVLFLTVGNLSLIPAILTFFKERSKKIALLFLNVLGLLIAIPVVYLIYAMSTIQC